MSANELLLIDLSGIAHMIWHVSGKEPDQDFVSAQTVARVRSLAAAHPHAAICCDSGKSFRADIDPTYKANRDTENRAPLRHQMDIACDTLRKDGFPVWSVEGFEADDIIATATANALKMDADVSVLIVSSDKDLLQLVSDRVRVKSLVTGQTAGPADVFDKWGVKPEQMGDLLALMGDKSDNIVGAEKIGKTIGARLLCEHGSLEALYGVMGRGVVAGVTPNMRTNLMEFQARWPVVAKLIALRTDVPIEFSEIAAERVAPPMEAEAEMMDYTERGEHDAPREPFKQGADANDQPLPQEMRELDQNESLAALAGATQRVSERMAQPTNPDQRAAPNAVAVGRIVAEQPAPPVSTAPVEFSQQLEPRSMQEAVVLSDRMYQSRMFSAYGTPQAVLATIMAGRELGIPAMASLRAFHVIEGRPSPSADTLAALVMRSGKAKYFRCSERTPESATFVTQRLPVEDYPPQSLTFTLAEAKAAWKKDQKAWDASGWGRTPSAMLVARAKSALARLEYPDVVGNLYGFEELD